MTPWPIQFVELSNGGVLGGSLTGIVALIKRLDRRRFESALMLVERKGIEEDLARRGVRVELLPPLPPRLPSRSGSRLGRAVVRMRDLVLVVAPRARVIAAHFRQSAPALVYLANGLTANLEGVVAAALCRLPIICHEKGFRRVGPVERLMSRWVDTCITMTDDIRDHYARRGVRPGRFLTIHDGIDCARYAAAATGGDAVRREFGIPADAPLIGIVGHIQEWKGQLLAVEAVARARQHLPALRCLVVGGVHRSGVGYSERLRARIAEAGLGEHVILTGPRHDVPACFDAMDVAVHASLTPEPFGRVLIEAMAAGRPVVAPREGGPLLIVEDGVSGLLVPPRDPAALADALIALCTDPARRAAMGAAAQARVAAHFDIRTHVAAVEALFERVLGNGDRPVAA